MTLGLGLRAPWARSFALVLTLAGCGGTVSGGGMTAPGSDALTEYGLRERCPEDASCYEAAVRVLGRILADLGMPLTDPMPPNSPVGRLAISFEHDPPYGWEADDASGTAAQVVVDVTDPDAAWVLLDGDIAYSVRPELARALVDALYLRTD